MFIHDLDSTASYRTLARGVGCGFSRAYQASQRERAVGSASGRAAAYAAERRMPERGRPGRR